MSKILDKIVLRDTKTGISTEYTIQDTQLKERVENLIANKNDTNGNSELIDIRTGFDGNKYDTAGDAVRSQVSNLQEQVNDINNNGLIFNDDYISLKIDTWLKDHPEATTTVLDNSITKEKIEKDFLYDLRKARFYNSVADMKLDSELKAGQVCKTLGYYSINDGGGAYYVIRAKQDSDVDDGGSIHELASGLVAELIVENGTVNVKQFGAKGDGVTDDTIAIQKAINTKYNVVLLPETYGINGNMIIELNNQTLKCVNGKAKFLSLVSATKTQNAGTTSITKKAVVVICDSNNFAIENIDIDGQGTWIERPRKYTDEPAPFDTYNDYRKRTVQVLQFLNCTNFNVVNVSAKLGLNGFLFSNCQHYVCDSCKSTYTLADGFYNTYKSAFGIIKNCYVAYNGDDSFSINHDFISGTEGIDIRPHDIVIDHCKAEHSMGALSCMHGSYNTKIKDSVGYDIKQSIIRFGGHAHNKTEEQRAIGHNQTCENCYIETSDTVHEITSTLKGQYNTDIGIVGSVDSGKDNGPYNISLKNTTIKRSNATEKRYLNFNYGKDVLIDNCYIDGFDVSIASDNTVISNCNLNQTDAGILRLANNVTIINNHITNNNVFRHYYNKTNEIAGFVSDRAYGVVFKNNNVVFNNNTTELLIDMEIYKATNNNDSLTDIYSPFKVDSEKVMALGENHKYDIIYDGVINLDLSDTNYNFKWFKTGQLIFDKSDSTLKIVKGLELVSV